MTQDSSIPRKLLFLYGSEKGNSESIAKRLHQESSAEGFESSCFALNEFKKLKLEELDQWPRYPVIIVTSSYGDGDPPDNAQTFWRMLRRKPTNPGSLAHVRFILLGLGDSNYDSYQGFPASLFAKLTQLGAKPIIKMGQADAAAPNMEEYVEPWITDFWLELEEFFETGKTLNIELPPAGSTEASVTPKSISAAGTPSTTPKPPGSPMLEPSKVEHIPSVSSPSETITKEHKETRFKISNGSSSTNGLEKPIETIKINNTEFPSTISSPSIPISSVAAPSPSGTPSPNKPAKPPIVPKPYAHITKLEFTNQLESELSTSHPKPAATEGKSRIPTKSAPFFAKIVDCRVLTSDNAVKRVVEMTLDMTGSAMTLIPGDAAGIIPQNDRRLVSRLLSVLNAPNQVFTLANRSSDAKSILPEHIKTPCTLENCFLNYVNINGIVGKRTLVTLASYCPADSASKTQLMTLATDPKLYSEEIEKNFTNIVDVLEKYDDCKPDIGHLLDSLPPLAPRYFSISNFVPPGPSYAQVLRFAFSVVINPLNDKKTFYGVATNWLNEKAILWFQNKESSPESSPDELKIPVFARPRSEFILGEDMTRPIIMVGPGTGVSPFIGFLEQREHHGHKHSEGCGNVGPSFLFTGNRHPDQDYLYHEELEHFKKVEIIQNHIPAFSRLNPSQVTYVQHKMLEDETSKKIVDLMVNQDAVFYLCGDAKSVAPAVKEAFVKMLTSQLGITEQEAKDMVLTWSKSKRYLLDIWG